MKHPHPNAVAGAVGGAGGGPLIVYVLSLFGVEVDPYVAAVIAGASASLALFIGRSGVRGVFRLVWRGRS
jgi:hypothetical protein